MNKKNKVRLKIKINSQYPIVLQKSVNLLIEDEIAYICKWEQIKYLFWKITCVYYIDRSVFILVFKNLRM